MQMRRYDLLDSTNEEGKRLFHRGALTDAACLVAREQTAGKGTRGRRWESPRDAGLYFSVIDVAPRAAAIVDPGAITLAAGTACARLLRESTGLNVSVKPVNDLYLAGGKLGGILTEAIVEGEVVRAMIIGVGINVWGMPNALADGTRATCLAEHLSPQAMERLDTPTLITALADAVYECLPGSTAEGRDATPGPWA
ncbi:MAG: biotin--[acetyl-CoA-carboxylase] ligase [Planctomycetes bacterium]|nr:biotin--[acetyl-CoA-carboxylase] ligase [Planctomycetota bacterium]